MVSAIICSLGSGGSGRTLAEGIVRSMHCPSQVTKPKRHTGTKPDGNCSTVLLFWPETTKGLTRDKQLFKQHKFKNTYSHLIFLTQGQRVIFDVGHRFPNH